MSKILEDFWTGIVGTIVAAGSWLVMRVVQMDARFKELQLNNEMLAAEIKHRDTLREADRADMADVKQDVRDIKNVLLGKGV